MNDTERVDFLERMGADTGKVDGMHRCLVWGEQLGVNYVVASGHALTLRDAIDAAVLRYERYQAERRGKGQAA